MAARRGRTDADDEAEAQADPREVRRRDRGALRLRLVQGLILLAIPAAVWIWAGVETVSGSCDYECGDEGQFWLLLGALTAPLIWLGVLFAGGGPPGPGAWAAVLALACLVFAGYWGLIGVPVLICGLVVIAVLVVAGRRRSRRYPEEIEARYP